MPADVSVLNREPRRNRSRDPTLSRTGGARARRAPLPLRDSEINPRRLDAADVGLGKIEHERARLVPVLPP
jgi:hypothetical protein